MYFVYILQSEKRVRFYIGVTTDLNQRIKDHNRGSTPSTRPYRPWKMIYHETFASKTDAYKREYFLKHPPGYLEKKNILEKYRQSV